MIFNKNYSFFNDNIEFVSSLKSNAISITPKKKSLAQKISIITRSIFDLATLLINFKHGKLIFTTPNIPSYEMFFEKSKIEDCTVINYHTTKIFHDFNGERVHNIGLFTKLFDIKFLKRKESKRIYNFYFLLLKIIKYDEIFIPCYYDNVTLNLVLSKTNKKITEIQHGSIINFFPYSRPSPIKLVDEIYVNNEKTKKFLQENLYKNFETKITLKPFKYSDDYEFSESKETIVLYCSSIEVNGIHPVLYAFIKENRDFKLKIRMHPRESSKKIFSDILELIDIEYDFDELKDWKDNMSNYNLIVITPWSSIAEESTELSIKTIIIDPIGRKRFKHLIDNNICQYSNNLKDTLK